MPISYVSCASPSGMVDKDGGSMKPDALKWAADQHFRIPHKSSWALSSKGLPHKNSWM